MIEICYCIDRNTEACGFVSLHSLLRRVSEKTLVMICYDREEKIPGADWGRRLSSFGFDFELRHQGIDNSVFRNCRSTFGSYAAYLLLGAADHALSEKLLYLDADCIFTDDIRSLYHTDLGGKDVGLLSYGDCSMRDPNETKILKTHGKTASNLYYGTQVVLFDTGKHRQSRRLQRYQKIAAGDPFLLMLWDQTVINCAFADSEIKDLKPVFGEWNQQAPRDGSAPDFAPGMIHYAGTPKPWDLFGEFFHPCYRQWREAAAAAGLRGVALRNYISRTAIKRALNARKQYAVWFKRPSP